MSFIVYSGLFILGWVLMNERFQNVWYTAKRSYKRGKGILARYPKNGNKGENYV